MPVSLMRRAGKQRRPHIRLRDDRRDLWQFLKLDGQRLQSLIASVTILTMSVWCSLPGRQWWQRVVCEEVGFSAVHALSDLGPEILTFDLALIPCYWKEHIPAAN